jgi:lysine-specific histone demethylase 1
VPDAQIIEKAMAILRVIFKDKDVPDPVATAVTRWGSDQFAMGSYSCVGQFLYFIFYFSCY